MFPLREELRRLAEQGRPLEILIVRSGALGDTILLLPTVHRLQAAFPQARLTLMGSRWAGQIVPMLESPCELLAFESPRFARLFAPDGWQDAPPLLRGKDLAVIYTAEPRGAFVRNTERACRGAVIPWPVRPPGGVHAACHLAAAVAAKVPAPHELPRPSVRPSQEAAASARAWLSERVGQGRGALVIVHPGSGSRSKCWPAPRFAQLIRALRRRTARVALLAGPADDESCGAVLSALSGGDAPPVARFENLEAVAALIACADAFVGNDSGVTHLAAAIGVPTLAIFGPTDPATWGPLGRTVAVVRGDASETNPLAWPDVPDALAALPSLGTIGP